MPIYKEKYKNKTYFENAIIYEEISTTYKSNLFLVDKESKTIIIDTDNIIDSLIGLCYDCFSKKNISELIVDKLADYKLISFNSIKHEILSLINNKNNELINKNLDKICEDGKSNLDYNVIVERCENDIKISYILNRNMNFYSPNYLLKSDNSEFYNFEKRIFYFILLYLRDKNSFIKTIEDEFDIIINKDSYSTQHLNKRLC